MDITEKNFEDTRELYHKLKKYIQIIKNKSNKSTLYIFDYHNVITNENNKGETIDDKNIVDFLKYLYKSDNYIFIISYGGKNRNNITKKYINDHKFLKNIPQIYVEKKNKGLIIKILVKLLSKYHNHDGKFVFFDDKINNIESAKKYNRNGKYLLVHYVGKTTREYKNICHFKTIEKILKSFESGKFVNKVIAMKTD